MDDGIPEPIGNIPEEKWQAGIDKEFLDVFSEVERIEERESQEQRNRALRIERRQQFGLSNKQRKEGAAKQKLK